MPIEQGAALQAAAKAERESVKESLEAKLLRDVVLAISSVGMAHLLAELPEVLAYFGGQNAVGRRCGRLPSAAGADHRRHHVGR